MMPASAESVLLERTPSGAERKDFGSTPCENPVQSCKGLKDKNGKKVTGDACFAYFAQFTGELLVNGKKVTGTHEVVCRSSTFGGCNDSMRRDS